MKITICFLFGLLVLMPDVCAQDHDSHQSKYAGEQERTIKNLSADDIKAIRNGEGWGLAKPAELNGYPGPLHVLQMADEIALSDTQREEVEVLYEDMRSKAILAGERYLMAETELDMAFLEGTVDAESLTELVDSSATALGALRNVHLQAHLKMMHILTQEQIKRYNMLRGYTGDPCSAVPQGHDPVMWRKHNGCTEN